MSATRTAQVQGLVRQQSLTLGGPPVLMTLRAPSSVCLTCQVRQAVVGRRQLSLVQRRRLETLALRPLDDGVVLGNGTIPGGNTEKQEHVASGGGHDVAVDVAPKPWAIDTQLVDLRAALQGLEELWQQKDHRVQVLRTLSNPWPKVRHHRVHNEKKLSAASKHELPEANAAPIPHETFRTNLMKATSDKIARQILRAQLLRCEKPVDIRRVIATALVQSRHTRAHISVLHEPIMRALYRCRNHADDQAILDTLSGIHSRFKFYDVPFDPQFLMLGLKFAARTRSLKGMKKYLKALRQSGKKMTSNVFRAIIAKFSIGHRGLGEIRNGRWRRDELLQVLNGFEDSKHLPLSQQYHLGCYLDRSDWQYLHGWIAVLARCKDAEAVWHEWRLWKKSEARMKPKNLASMHKLMTTKLRGDYWFIEQMTYSGGLKEAWRMLEDAGIKFSTLKDRIKTKLLEGVEFCTVWSDDIRDELIRKYDADLGMIESALGVRWISADDGIEDGAEGYHALVEDQDEVLERLGADDWKLEDDYGFPYENSPIVPQQERSLHDAAETTPVEPADVLAVKV